ncbi:MAG: hypothetical protein P0Y59_13425 [Candidatus Sphingomonas phytovorans]|nr:hypothetical protein [Sphingomonas sp.]WEJ97961.1 MAG: hypothetical protein P0Y59_13425 [Sphingomonas sp.]
MKNILGLSAATAALWSVPASAQTLYLVCLGSGAGNRVSSSTAYGFDNHGNSAWGQVVGQRSVPFDDQVNVEINDDGTGRVRMPRAMLPPVHGGSGGWFQVKNVKRSDSEITGTIQVNVINSPKLRLDRIGGRISINGKAGDYSGECQPYDPASIQRKF